MARNFFSLRNDQTNSGVHQGHMEWILVALFQGVDLKQPCRDAEHTLPLKVKAKMNGAVPPIFKIS
jgi:hypothetical protein